MKTSFPKPSAPAWYVVDATDQVLGRLSAKIARVIKGKHKPSYVPHWRCGDHVVVLNAAKVKVSGSKWEQKTYFRHTKFFGGVKTTSLEHLMTRDPAEVFRLAVKGMLPKNLSREHLLKQLHVFGGDKHIYDAQKPQPFPSLI